MVLAQMLHLLQIIMQSRNYDRMEQKFHIC